MRLSFRNIRIFILLVILIIVAGDQWLGAMRTTRWDKPLWVLIYPINADGSETSQSVIDQLNNEDFQDIEVFFSQQAREYGIDLEKPFELLLAHQVMEPVPATPSHDDGPLAIALWSLKMRWWAWRVDHYQGPLADIRMFVEYYSDANQMGYHSFGLQKGRLATARIFASKKYRQRNEVVIAHELLHTLGATDKYDLNTLLPLYPDGYADPRKVPLFPQKTALLMAGRIPVSKTEADMPASLNQCIVSEKTATEIRWRR
jgi:hypothetical protein